MAKCWQNSKNCSRFLSIQKFKCMCKINLFESNLYIAISSTLLNTLIMNHINVKKMNKKRVSSNFLNFFTKIIVYFVNQVPKSKLTENTLNIFSVCWKRYFTASYNYFELIVLFIYSTHLENYSSIQVSPFHYALEIFKMWSQGWLAWNFTILLQLKFTSNQTLEKLEYRK